MKVKNKGNKGVRIKGELLAFPRERERDQRERKRVKRAQALARGEER